MVYVENFPNSTTKILELIREFNKVFGYKINIGKPIAFPQTSNNNNKTECNFINIFVLK